MPKRPPMPSKKRYNEKMPMIGGRVPRPVYDWVTKKAASMGISRGKFVTRALTEWHLLAKTFADKTKAMKAQLEAEFTAKHVSATVAMREKLRSELFAEAHEQGRILGLSQARVEPMTYQVACHCGRTDVFDLRRRDHLDALLNYTTKQCWGPNSRHLTY